MHIGKSSIVARNLCAWTTFCIYR